MSGLRNEYETLELEKYKLNARLRQIERYSDVRGFAQTGGSTEDGKRLRNEYHMRDRFLSKQRRKALNEMFELQEQLQRAKLQQEHEPILFRTTSAWLRWLKARDPDERINSREFRHALRLASDFGSIVIQERQRGLQPDEGKRKDGVQKSRNRGKLSMGTKDAAVIRESNYCKVMAGVYKVIEHVLIKYEEMPPRDEEISLGPVSDDNGTQPGQALAQQLSAARRELQRTLENLHSKRVLYRANRTEYMSTYEPDADAESEDLSPDNFFDRWHLEEIEAANDGIRNAETKHWGLRNQAPEEKLYDAEEWDPFGILHPPSDGFTRITGNTRFQQDGMIWTAGVREKIIRWLGNVSGRRVDVEQGQLR